MFVVCMSLLQCAKRFTIFFSSFSHVLYLSFATLFHFHDNNSSVFCSTFIFVVSFHSLSLALSLSFYFNFVYRFYILEFAKFSPIHLHAAYNRAVHSRFYIVGNLVCCTQYQLMLFYILHFSLFTIRLNHRIIILIEKKKLSGNWKKNIYSRLQECI